jgi:secreted trypsin-like serine protease
VARYRAAIAAALAAVVVAAAAPVAEARSPGTGAPATASVIGGRTASIAEFPWLAYIAVNGEDGVYSCTGAVVAPRVVLTAGHCIEKETELAPLPPTQFRVITGIADVSQATAANVSQVSRAVFYPNFETARLQIDAGLLVLQAPVSAPPLAIASGADAALIKAGTPISIAGWGLTAPRANIGPAVPRTGELTLRSQAACRRGTRPYEPLYSPAGQICALDTPDRTVSGCFGDSGGPAIARRADGTPVEVGIVVSGGPECSREVPNVYTSVTKISGWVSGWIASAESGAPPPPTPKASPPYLSFELAKVLSVEFLAERFRSRFGRGTEKRAAGCNRLAWDRVRCRVSWHLGERRFHGSFTIDLEVDGYEVFPRAKIRVRSSAA